MDTIAELIAFPDFNTISGFIKQASVQERKHIVLLARHQGIPTGFGNLYYMTQTTVLGLVDHFLKAEDMTMTERMFLDVTTIYNRIDYLLSHPLYTGAVMMSCFIAPITDDEVQRIKLESYLKEIHIMDTDPYFPNFDFRCFFGDYDRPLHSTMQPNPTSARIVHEAIQLWVSRHAVPSKVHTAAISNKLIPRFSRHEMSMFLDATLRDPDVATQGTLEYLHMVHNIDMEGPCEMKQRWYPSFLTPRTYYVCGASLFNSTKYTKDLWNDLCDSLVTTHRRNRVNPNRIRIEGIQRALFYDLSSFTSNCAVQREFLNALTLHVDGLPFTIQDSLHGEYQADFGDVIRDYNNANIHPTYATGDYSYKGVHGVAGFLGVYGNIATCTFIHGAFLLQLSTEHYASGCGCAGDDAVLVTVEDEDTIWMCISLVGVLAREKTFSSDDPDCVYLKRRVWKDEAFCRLASSTYIQLPNFLLFAKDHEKRRFRESYLTGKDLKILACNSLHAFFRSSVPYYSTPVFWQIRQFAERYYSKLHIPVEGNVPQFTRFFSHDWTVCFIPSVNYLGMHDYIVGTIQSRYPGYCFLEERPAIESPVVIRPQKGDVVSLLKGQNTSLLVKTGFLRPIRSGVRMHLGEAGLEALIETYRGGPHDTFARYEVVDDIDAIPFPPTLVGSMDSDFLIRSLFDEVEYVSEETLFCCLRGKSSQHPRVDKSGLG